MASSPDPFAVMFAVGAPRVMLIAHAVDTGGRPMQQYELRNVHAGVVAIRERAKELHAQWRGATGRSEQSSRRARIWALPCLITLTAFSKSMLVHIVTFSIYFVIDGFRPSDYKSELLTFPTGSCGGKEAGMGQAKNLDWHESRSSSTQFTPEKRLALALLVDALREIHEHGDDYDEAVAWLMGVQGYSEDSAFSAECVCET